MNGSRPGTAKKNGKHSVFASASHQQQDPGDTIRPRGDGSPTSPNFHHPCINFSLPE
jgi:hypothetical protein